MTARAPRRQREHCGDFGQNADSIPFGDLGHRNPGADLRTALYLCSATLSSHSMSGSVKHQAKPKCQASSGTAQRRGAKVVTTFSTASRARLRRASLDGRHLAQQAAAIDSPSTCAAAARDARGRAGRGRQGPPSPGGSSARCLSAGAHGASGCRAERSPAPARHRAPAATRRRRPGGARAASRRERARRAVAAEAPGAPPPHPRPSLRDERSRPCAPVHGDSRSRTGTSGHDHKAAERGRRDVCPGHRLGGC